MPFEVKTTCYYYLKDMIMYLCLFRDLCVSLYSAQLITYLWLNVQACLKTEREKKKKEVYFPLRKYAIKV